MGSQEKQLVWLCRGKPDLSDPWKGEPPHGFDSGKCTIRERAALPSWMFSSSDLTDAPCPDNVVFPKLKQT